MLRVSSIAALVLLAPIALAQTQLAQFSSPDDPSPLLNHRGPVAVSGNVAAANVRSLGSSIGDQVLVYDVQTGQHIRLWPDLAVKPGGLPIELGSSLQVDVDGDRVIVGSRHEDTPFNEAGRAFVFSAATGAELLDLSSADAAAGDEFGADVAIDGNTIVVGASLSDDQGLDAGSVYVFDADTGALRFELFASNAQAGAEFGASVDVHGNLALVGSPMFGAGNKGQAYVFDVTTGVELHRLQPAFPTAGLRVGTSVALHGTMGVVGTLTGFPFEEAAYVFDLTTGAEVHKLTGQPDSGFGEHVAIDGTYVLVTAEDEDDFGVDGAFRSFDLATGVQLARIETQSRGVALGGGLAYTAGAPTPAPSTSGGYLGSFDPITGQLVQAFEGIDFAWGDQFGSAVAFDGDTAAFLAPFDDDLGTSTPSFYIVDIPTGDVRATIHPPTVGSPTIGGIEVMGNRVFLGTPDTGSVRVYDATTGQSIATWSGIAAGLGSSLDGHGNQILVGAASARRAFLMDASTGAIVHSFVPPVAQQDSFARSAAFDGTWVVIGAPAFDPVPDSVYVFDAASGQLVTTLIPGPAPGNINFFGDTVAVDGPRVLVGDPGYDLPFPDTNIGAVWVFDTISGAELRRLDPVTSLDGSDAFGAQLALRGSQALVSATYHFGIGSIFGFDTETGAELFILSPQPAVGLALHGSRMDVSGDRVLGGAPGEESFGDKAGSAYLFQVPTTPATIEYCAAKPSSVGCVAQIGTSAPGSIPTSLAADFSIIATGVEGSRTGLLVGGLSGTIAAPFAGGTLCVAPPWKRGPTLFSNGSPGACDGSYSQVVNDAPFPAGFDALSGQTAWYQWWYRDPGGAGGPVALSNAIEVPFL